MLLVTQGCLSQENSFRSGSLSHLCFLIELFTLYLCGSILYFSSLNRLLRIKSLSHSLCQPPTRISVHRSGRVAAEIDLEHSSGHAGRAWFIESPQYWSSTEGFLFRLASRVRCATTNFELKNVLFLITCVLNCPIIETFKDSYLKGIGRIDKSITSDTIQRSAAQLLSTAHFIIRILQF